MPQKYFAHATVKAQESEDGVSRIIGRAIEYNRVGYFGWGFRLAVPPNAANTSLESRKDSPDRDALALVAHNSAKVLGRTNQGTLRFTPGAEGVDYEIDVNMADPEGVSAYEKVKRGEFTASSIGFYIVESHEEVMADNSLDADVQDVQVNVEVADEIDIIEVSVLAHGAFGGSTSMLAANAHYEIVSKTIDPQGFITPEEANELAGTPESEVETPDSGVEAETVSDPETETEAEAETETEAEAEIEAEPEDDAETVSAEPEPETEAVTPEVEAEVETEIDDTDVIESDTESEDITEVDGEGDTVESNEGQDGTSSGDTDEVETEGSIGAAADSDSSDGGDTGPTLSFRDARLQASRLGLIDLLTS